MRVLLVIHHHLDPHQGASGATLSLGRVLTSLGCRVEYFGFDQAFGTSRADGRSLNIRFPWRVSSFLCRSAKHFDVIDTSCGDSWLWAARGRPGARVRHCLTTRSHGLEHLADMRFRQEVAAGRATRSWKYPIYHGGYRLWEVAQSLRRADHVFVLNEMEKRVAEQNVYVRPARLSVVPNGIKDHFMGLPEPKREGGPTKLAFIGNWTSVKGPGTLVQAATRLHDSAFAFELSLLGTGLSAESVAADFPERVRPRLRVTPRFLNETLPSLLAAHQILVAPSVSEGFSQAIIEAMACGLAVITTPVGAAPEVVGAAKTGVLTPAGDAEELFNNMTRLLRDPGHLYFLRSNAYKFAQQYTWQTVGTYTLRRYERMIDARQIETPDIAN